VNEIPVTYLGEHAFDDIQEYAVESRSCVWTARGYISFVKIRRDRNYRCWICDECFELVTPAKFNQHASNYRLH
jgi:hypothetical protein